MSKLGKDSSIDKRLRELNREAERVRSDIKSMSKSLDEPGGSDVPVITDLGGLRQKPSRDDAARAPKPQSPPGHVPKLGARRGQQGLFKWQGRGGGNSSQVSGAVDRPQPVPTLFGAEAGGGEDRQPQFVSYLSTGSFKAPRNSRREKSVQRNKAVFMIVVVSVALYIVSKLLR